MEKVDCCPFCSSCKTSVEIIQTHRDKYLDLIDPALNENPRYWMKCGNCHFFFHAPRIDDEEEKVLYMRYRDSKFKGYSGDEYFDRLVSLPIDESEAYKRVSYIRDTIPSNAIKSVIDIGCGVGIVLYYIKKFFPYAHLTGIKPNAEYAEVVRRRLGIEVIEDYYREDLVKERFNLMLSIDVMEHVRSFRKYFGIFSQNISQDKGYLFLEIPGVGNFKNVNQDNDVFESPHFYFFHQSHIIQLVKDNNFSLIDQKETINRGIKKELFIFQYGEG